jgi:hypothetical protein
VIAWEPFLVGVFVGMAIGFGLVVVVCAVVIAIDGDW